MVPLLTLLHRNKGALDMRKASIFALVEIYMVMGDAFYPYTEDLSPAQRKLLTIYIDRKLKNRG